MVVQIPQRFQAVNAVSPFGAGIRLLPLTLSAPCGSFLASLLSSKNKVPSIILLLIAAALQILGTTLLSTLTSSVYITPAQYGYQVLLGFGLGMSIPVLLLLVERTVRREHQCEQNLCWDVI